ncbi:MAG: restriction endonuclease [Gammaproteobacteria bacterium]|nr:restriction endonuclease [Gammaproteobacteria bacterium]
MLETIPVGWAHCLIGDIAYLKNGFAFKSKNYLTDGIPVIRISDIQDGVVTSENSVKVKLDKDLESFSVLNGDVLIAMSGATTGKFGIYKSEKAAYQNQRVGNIKPRSKDIGKQFFFYFLYSAKKEIEKRAYGGAQPNISAEKIESIPFAFPPFNEQHRIVAKIEELFSELDKGIESLKTALKQLKVYRQTVLKHAFEGNLTARWREENKDKLESASQLLDRIQKEREARYQQEIEGWKDAVKAWEDKGKEGKKPAKSKRPVVTGNPEIPGDLAKHCADHWTWLKLYDISEVSGGLTKNQKRNALLKKMKYLRVANVYADKLLLDKITEIGVTEEEFRKLKLIAGDLLVVEGNGSIDQIGRLAVWTGEIDQIGHQNHLIRVRLIDGMLPRFFLLFLLSPLGRKFIIKQASSTSGLHTLSISKVSGLPVPIPNLYEQEALLTEVDEILSRIDKMESDISAEAKRSETLRQSILKKAFSGQLVEQDPNDEPASVLLERIRAEKARQKPRKKTARKRKAATG